MEGNFEKYKNMKFLKSPNVGTGFTKQEAEDIYAEAIRRIEWEIGIEQLSFFDDKKIEEMIMEKVKELTRIYVEKQSKEKAINKIADLIKEKCS